MALLMAAPVVLMFVALVVMVAMFALAAYHVFASFSSKTTEASISSIHVPAARLAADGGRSVRIGESSDQS